MKILVCGSAGQLGSELRAIAPRLDYSFIFTDVDTLDITDFDAVERIVTQYNIDTIVNCAAYTAVDRAETERDIAHKINTIGARTLADVAAKHDTALIHISTDYVFDGTKRTPYLESDSTAPLGVYGMTKYDGERAVIDSCCRGIIIRTSWLYSCYGNNFVKTMLRLGAEKESLNVVCDQSGTPTYAADLARTIVEILPNIGSRRGEIYHYSDLGQTSWTDFAAEIMRLAGLSCRINPIPSAQYPTPTERPKYSVLSKDKIMSDFSIEIPQWQDSLAQCIKLLLK